MRVINFETSPVRKTHRTIFHKLHIPMFYPQQIHTNKHSKIWRTNGNAEVTYMNDKGVIKLNVSVSINNFAEARQQIAAFVEHVC